MQALSARGPTATIRAEDELLLCCARTELDAERADRIKALLREDFDWEYLLRVAPFHGITPLLYRHLNTVCPEAVPAATLNSLRVSSVENSKANLFATGELCKVLDLYESHGVPAISFKGPLLAASAYGNLSLRQFADLDILVHERHVPKAIKLALSQGYRPAKKLSRRQQASLLESKCEYVLARGDIGNMNLVYLEIHSRFVPRTFSFPLNMESVEDRLQEASLGGTKVRTLSDEDLLLVLCVHSATHLWQQLKWICDVAELVRACPDLDWEKTMRRAEELGSKRMLLLGLFLAENLLGTALPNEVQRRVAADPVVRSLAEEATLYLFRDMDAIVTGFLNGYPGNGRPGYSARSIFHIKAMDRLRDRVQYCVRFATTSLEEDYDAVSLPDALFPLYRVVRLMRLSGLSARALWRRLA